MAVLEFDHATKRFPDGTVAVDDLCLEVKDGEFMVFVGPSGCGKTTALRMLAGLEDISEGELRIGGEVINDIEAADRDIAMVFQTYALYPHMSVRANLAFPLKMRGIKGSQSTSIIDGVAEMLGITPLLERKPGELSGGQRQRVAMGRAIVRHPQGFLMDEPLSNLDAKLRVQMRAELARLHERLRVTTLYVTHDQTEAMTLGHRVAVLRDGVVQQVAPPRELYDHPVNTFVASFIGSPSMNFVDGTLAEGTVRFGQWSVELPEATRASIGRASGPVLVGFRPEYLAPAAGDDGAAVILPAEMKLKEELGSQTLAYLEVPGIDVAEVGERPIELAGTLHAQLAARVNAGIGDHMDLALSAEGIRLFNPESGESLVSDRAASVAVA